MKRYFIPVSIAMLFLMSCLQENLEPAINPDWPATDPKPKVSKFKTVTYGDDNSSFTYDDQGRIILSQYSDGSRNEYTYHQDYLDRMIYGSDGTLRLIETYEINSKGLAFKSTRTDKPDYTYWYEYNSNDQLIKLTSEQPDHKFEQFVTYKDGNIDTEVYKLDSVLQYTYKYTYYSDSPNGLDNIHWGKMYLGKGSKDLVKNWYGIGQNGNIHLNILNSYSFDSKGRVASLTQFNGETSNTTTYAYY